MTALEETRTIDLALAPQPPHHLSVDSPQDHQEGGDPCSKMRYRRRNYLTDSLAVAVWAADLLVGYRVLEEASGLLTLEQAVESLCSTMVRNLYST